MVTTDFSYIVIVRYVFSQQLVFDLEEVYTPFQCKWKMFCLYEIEYFL